MARWGSWKWQAGKLHLYPPHSRSGISVNNLRGLQREVEITSSQQVFTLSSLGKQSSLGGGTFSKNFESHGFLGFERRKCDLADVAVRWFCVWLRGCPGSWTELNHSSLWGRSPVKCHRALFVALSFIDTVGV